MSIRFGFVSTFPPTQCGLATFTAALHGALTSAGVDEGQVVRVVDVPQMRPSASVVAQLAPGDEAGTLRAAARLNECDVVVIQHEFGIFGGRDGSDILALLGQLRVPSVVVLHTVLVEPTTNQRAILEAVVDHADAVVTMTATARQRLAGCYDVDMDKVSIIAHGASDTLMPKTLTPMFRDASPVVLSWGLLGPGKGIEWGIDAMAKLVDLRPAPRYVIAGQTHPKVMQREGDRYLAGLRDRIRRLGLDASVSLDGRYRDAAGLAELVASADVVLLPYDSTDQVTSGVLIEAVTAGKPVVATAFPHAVELLAKGAGIVVPHRDAASIAEALRTIITRPDLANSMSAAAMSATPPLLWPAVAGRYRELATQLIKARAAA